VFSNLSFPLEDERTEDEALYRELGLCSEMRQLARRGHVIVLPIPTPTSSNAKGQVK